MKKFTRLIKNEYFPITIITIDQISKIGRSIKHHLNNLNQVILTDHQKKLLLYFPDKRVQKQILHHFFLGKINLISWHFNLIRIKKQFTPKTQLEGEFFSLTFLDSKFLEEYRLIRNWIEQNPKKSKAILEKLLIYPRDSLALNAARLLNKIFPSDYIFSTPMKLLPLLSTITKKKIFHQFEFWISNYQITIWEERRLIIEKICLLNLPETLDLLIKFLDDPELECRHSLAKVLKNYHHEDSRYTLIKLMFEDNKKIVHSAISSYKQVMNLDPVHLSRSDCLCYENPLNLLLNLDIAKISQISPEVWSFWQTNPSFIQKNLRQSNTILISNYIKFDISDNTINRSFKILFALRMPNILSELHHFIKEISQEEKKHLLVDLIEYLSATFSTKIDKQYRIIL